MAFKQSSPRPRFVDLTLFEQLAVGQETGKDYKYLAAFINHYRSESDEGEMLQVSSKWRATLIALDLDPTDFQICQLRHSRTRVAQDFAKPPQSLQRRAKAAPAALEMLIHARLKF